MTTAFALEMKAHWVPGQRVTFRDANMWSKSYQMAYLCALKKFATNEFNGNLKANRKRMRTTEMEELADLYPESFMKFFDVEYHSNSNGEV